MNPTFTFDGSNRKTVYHASFPRLNLSISLQIKLSSQYLNPSSLLDDTFFFE